MGIEAPLVTDGILIPWEVGETRGTIFVMAHGRTDAFDANDCRLMKVLADFAAMGVRQQAQQRILMEKSNNAAAWMPPVSPNLDCCLRMRPGKLSNTDNSTVPVSTMRVAAALAMAASSPVVPQTPQLEPAENRRVGV